MKLEYAGFRIYRQPNGLYKCFGTTDRCDAEGNEEKTCEVSRDKQTAGEALAEAVEMTGVLKP